LSPLRLLVFDLDGTLVDSAGDLAAAVNETLARLGPGTPPLPLQTVRAFVGNGAGQLVARSLAQAGLAVSREEALAVFLDCYRARLLDTTRPYPGVVEGLDRLADRTLAVLSNKPGDMCRHILTELGLASRFARVWGGGDFAARKPDPGGLLDLLRELGASPAETLMVGDSPIDVRTARNAGVRVAGVRYGLDPAGLEADPPDLLVDSLVELSEHLERGELW
jgi:phosphoglycolate phosphatase